MSVSQLVRHTCFRCVAAIRKTACLSLSELSSFGSYRLTAMSSNEFMQVLVNDTTVGSICAFASGCDLGYDWCEREESSDGYSWTLKIFTSHLSALFQTTGRLS